MYETRVSREWSEILDSGVGVTRHDQVLFFNENLNFLPLWQEALYLPSRHSLISMNDLGDQ